MGEFFFGGGARFTNMNIYDVTEIKKDVKIIRVLLF